MGAIDLSFLNSWYNSREGILDSNTGASTTPDTSNAAVAAALLGASPLAGSTTATTDSIASTALQPPTPPWAVTSGASTSTSSSSDVSGKTATLVQSLLDGGKLIDPTTAKLQAPASDPNTTQNYKNLFALYQGLTGLQSIATQAQTDGPASFQSQQLQQAFQSGLQQVQSFLGGQTFIGFQVYPSAALASDTAATTVPQETDSYTTAPLYSGVTNGVVPAFQGNVQFAATVTKYSGAQTTINFDLSEMGSQPRTFANVLNYLNGKMAAAGVATRFADSFTPGGPQTETVGSTTINLPNSPNQYALTIKGSSVETLAFSAPATDPAVYVAQSSGIASGANADAVQQLVKFDAASSTADPSAINGQVFKQTLDPGVSQALATATAPDGSVYVLADVTGKVGGQAIQGAQDVALIKYDSAGNVVFTRTLGAPNSASGYGLAVSQDGSQVAVVGATTDTLDSASAATSAAPGAPQGFVTVFDGQGQEQWTQQTAAIDGTGSGGGMQPKSVAFGTNGMVYVAGQVDGTIAGASSSGSSDGYIQAFHATSVPLNDGTGASEWVVTPTYVSQFGTSGQDRATGVAVGGSSVYVSSMENGHAVVRSFDASGTTLTPAASRDLGSVQGGGLAGVAVNADGSVVVAGSTHNGALNGGTVTQAYGGGEEAFIASLAPDLQPSSGDRLTYVGSPTDQTATALAVSGGQVYLAGQVATTPIPGGGQATAFNGYVAAVDPQTGQVTWEQQYQGQDRQVAPASIAVGQTGASVLDQLGLPSAIDYAPSQQLVANSSVRPGDKFFIQSGSDGQAQAVTIAADDTYASLAQKIERASGFTLTATVLPGTGGDTLKLAPSFDGQQAQILAGPPGADALASLGLSEGMITSAATNEGSPVPNTSTGSLPPANSLKNGYSLNLPSSLNLDTTASISAAVAALGKAASTVQGIYTDMTTPPAPAASTAGAVPAYLTAQIADYQAALSRLTGGS